MRSRLIELASRRSQPSANSPMSRVHYIPAPRLEDYLKSRTRRRGSAAARPGAIAFLRSIKIGSAIIAFATSNSSRTSVDVSRSLALRPYRDHSVGRDSYPRAEPLAGTVQCALYDCQVTRAHCRIRRLCGPRTIMAALAIAV